MTTPSLSSKLSTFVTMPHHSHQARMSSLLLPWNLSSACPIFCCRCHYMLIGSLCKPRTIIQLGAVNFLSSNTSVSLTLGLCICWGGTLNQYQHPDCLWKIQTQTGIYAEEDSRNKSKTWTVYACKNSKNVKCGLCICLGKPHTQGPKSDCEYAGKNP